MRLLNTHTLTLAVRIRSPTTPGASSPEELPPPSGWQFIPFTLPNTDTNFPKSFTCSTNKLPLFAILSHTWGPDGSEITLQDVEHGLLHDADPPEEKKPGLAKIRGCCDRARLDGYTWAWIDTCCIDKASSAELSEAINSMFSWYVAAAVCYAHLADVGDHGLAGPFLGTGSGDDAVVVAEFRASRWFTRGWTLQELIAPDRVEFFSREWTELGTKRSLEVLVSEVTGISVSALGSRGSALTNNPAATKMRWASGRQTTREEDMSYCLLGLFGVNMPLLYGEGTRAFQRLQEEIVRAQGDYSILAWPGANDDGTTTWPVSALADTPEAFAGRLSFPTDISVELWDGLTQQALGDLRGHKIKRQSYEPPMIVSLGLLVTLPVRNIGLSRGSNRFLVSTEYSIHLNGRVMVLCIDMRVTNIGYIDDMVFLHRDLKGSGNPSCLRAIDQEELGDMQLMRVCLPRPGNRILRRGLGRQPTEAPSLLHVLLPATPNPRVTLIGTVPNHPVTTGPPSLGKSHNRPTYDTFYQLADYLIGIVNISVSAPGGPKFAILYNVSTNGRVPARCSVHRFHHIDPGNTGVTLRAAIQKLIDLENDALSDETPPTDRAALHFPEHGFYIRASIKLVPVDMGVEAGGGDGGTGGPRTPMCIRLAIDACVGRRGAGDSTEAGL